MKTLVRDVMSVDVLSVQDSTAFKEIVRTLEGHDISAVPVTDTNGVVIGIISEADLLLKEEQRNQERPLIQGPRRRRERHKAEGVVARELMTAPAVTVAPTATIAEAARLMHKRRVKRLPVVNSNGQPAGIVSRGDLLRVFLRSDEDIRAEVEDRIIGRLLGLDRREVRVTVREGEVSLSGQVEHRSMVDLVDSLVQGVEGVVGVETRLGWKVDDLVRQYPRWGPMP